MNQLNPGHILRLYVERSILILSLRTLLGIQVVSSIQVLLVIYRTYFSFFPSTVHALRVSSLWFYTNNNLDLKCAVCDSLITRMSVSCPLSSSQLDSICSAPSSHTLSIYVLFWWLQNKFRTHKIISSNRKFCIKLFLWKMEGQNV